MAQKGEQEWRPRRLSRGERSERSGGPGALRAGLRRPPLEYFEPFLVNGRVALDDHVLARDGLELRDQDALARLEDAGHLRVDAQGDHVTLDLPGHLPGFREDLITYGRDRLDPSRTDAIGATLAERPLERLLHSLAGHRDQTEVMERDSLARRAVVAKSFFERLGHLHAVAALVHINEIDDDDPAEVAQPDLAHKLIDRVNIRLEDGVFQTVRLPDVFPRIDVNRHQRFRLVDDDVAARLQPDFRLQRFLDLRLDAKLIEQRRVAGVELDVPGQRRLAAVDEIKRALVFRLVVHAH